MRLVFLGGLGEIGRNCFCLEVEGRILVVDCGLMFPDPDMPGVDLVLPDFTYLRENADRVEGVVVRGEQRGKALGVPTANLETGERTAIPADGVYAGWLAALDAGGQEAERWPAAISVGTNPTFDGQHRVVEAHALDRDDLDLYGVHVAVDFAARLRGMVRFDSVEALVAQMHADIAAARALTTGSGG